MQIANKYNLTGYCRNLSNGNVEAEIQGSGIDEFLKESLEHSYFIEINDYCVKTIDLIEDEKTFEVQY